MHCSLHRPAPWHTNIKHTLATKPRGSPPLVALSSTLLHVRSPCRMPCEERRLRGCQICWVLWTAAAAKRLLGF